MKREYKGKIQELRGLGLQIWSDDQGKMFARERCSCGGCFDNIFEIFEGDTVTSFKHLNICNGSQLKNIKLQSMEILIGENVQLDNVFFTAHDEAVSFFCGGAIYTNDTLEETKKWRFGTESKSPHNPTND